MLSSQDTSNGKHGDLPQRRLQPATPQKATEAAAAVAALDDAPVADLMAAVVEWQEESECEGLRQLEAHPHSPLGAPYCRQPATRPE